MIIYLEEPTNYTYVTTVFLCNIKNGISYTIRESIWMSQLLLVWLDGLIFIWIIYMIHK